MNTNTATASIDKATRNDIIRRDRYLRRYLNRRKTCSYRPETLPPSMQPGGKNAVPTNEERTAVELYDWANEPNRKGGPGRWIGYLQAVSNPEPGHSRSVVVSWTGALLARVTSIRTHKRPRDGRYWLSGVFGTFHAIGTNGVRYVGSHSGDGVYCRLRPAKNQPPRATVA